MIVLSLVVLALSAAAFAALAFGVALPPSLLVALAFAAAWCAAGLFREMKRLHRLGAFDPDAVWVGKLGYPTRAVVRWEGDSVVVLECSHRIEFGMNDEVERDQVRILRESCKQFTCSECVE